VTNVDSSNQLLEDDELNNASSTFQFVTFS